MFDKYACGTWVRTKSSTKYKKKITRKIRGPKYRQDIGNKIEQSTKNTL